MSEQILRNPKSKNRSVYNNGQKINETKQNVSSMMALTKIKNPLTNKFAVKQERKPSIVEKLIDTNDTKQNTQRSSKYAVFEKQNNYRFYADRFNQSSDESFVFDQSIRESRKQTLQQQIVKKFKNSRKEIDQLLRKSRQMREQKENFQQQHQKKQLFDGKDDNKMDKKEAKRKKLKFYHCDSIIIKPEFHPTKMFQLSIAPTLSLKTQNIVHHYQQNQTRQIQADQSFSQNHSKYQSAQKSLHHKFLDSIINQSPLEKLNDSNYHIDVGSPPFQEQRKYRSRSNYEEMSFVKDKFLQKKKIFQPKDYQHQNPFDRNYCVESNQYQQKSIFPKQFDKNSQQTHPTNSFKRRTKIFSTNDKRSGLKLSRVIRHEEEINKLKMEMGVDVFHIVIQQEEFLRQCCT